MGLLDHAFVPPPSKSADRFFTLSPLLRGESDTYSAFVAALVFAAIDVSDPVDKGDQYLTTDSQPREAYVCHHIVCHVTLRHRIVSCLYTGCPVDVEQHPVGCVSHDLQLPQLCFLRMVSRYLVVRKGVVQKPRGSVASDGPLYSVSALVLIGRLNPSLQK